MSALLTFPLLLLFYNINGNWTTHSDPGDSPRPNELVRSVPASEMSLRTNELPQSPFEPEIYVPVNLRPRPADPFDPIDSERVAIAKHTSTVALPCPGHQLLTAVFGH
uniref:Secreted protein n=1 Tax=Steinernema glaseri TaxID=37863 RepID=A0A1I7Y6S7_9BILA